MNDKTHIKTSTAVGLKLRYSSNVLGVNLKEFGDRWDIEVGQEQSIR